MKKSTLIALVAFAVLLVVVLLTREEHVNEGVPKLTLPTVDPAAVTSLEVSGAAATRLTFDSGAWSVASASAPEKRSPADETQVKYAVTQLTEVRAIDFVTENPAKHAELEVDDAKGLKVKASTSSGPVLELIIGKPAKAGGSYFRQAGSNAVFTTKAIVGPVLKKSLSAWRVKSITTAPVAEVAKISLAPAGGGGFTIVQDEKSTWALEGAAPAGFRFDPAIAGRVAQTLTSLSAIDFADAETDAAEAQTVATLTRKDGKPVVIRFGAKRPDGNVSVRVDGDPQLYVASGYVVEQLPKKLDQLRDTTLLSFSPEKVTRVTISTGGKKTVVARDGASWKMLEPKVAPPQFDPTQVNGFISRVHSMRATRAAPEVSVAAAGVASAPATVELALEGAKPQTLRYGHELPDTTAGKLVYVIGGADGLVYVVGAHEKSSFDSGAALFNKPPPPPQNMGGQMQGLDSLPPDIRAKLEAQLRQQQPH